nr:unnamed protein product [Digitaria exilis]
MLRLLYYYLAFFVASMLCVLLGPWFFAYYFGLEMMAMAAFFGYILAVNARRKDILARDQPLTKDLELGDVAQESASVPTGENA